MRLTTCGEVARHGGGDRYSHDYCDSMPRGHAGPHKHRPQADEYTAGVISAIEAQGYVVLAAREAHVLDPAMVARAAIRLREIEQQAVSGIHDDNTHWAAEQVLRAALDEGDPE